MPTISVPYHLDEPVPNLELPLPADLTIDPPLPNGTPWQRMAVLYDAVGAAVSAESEPVLTMSGDCTTSLGLIAGMQRAGRSPSVVWFDAHGDVQTPETTESGYLGGFPLRQLIGGSDRTAPDRLGLAPIPEERVLLVDARDLDPPEVEFLASCDVRRCSVPELAGGAATPPDGPLYLHVDVDVVDPTELPGLAIPAAGGPALDQVAAAVRTVCETGRVVAVGLACTWRTDVTVEPAIGALAAELWARVRAG